MGSGRDGAVQRSDDGRFVERLGDGVEVLAEVDGHPALVRQGAMMGAIFHPELADDPRLHELFLAG